MPPVGYVRDRPHIYIYVGLGIYGSVAQQTSVYYSSRGDDFKTGILVFGNYGQEHKSIFLRKKKTQIIGDQSIEIVNLPLHISYDND